MSSEAKITLTAVDKTGAAFNSAKQGLQGLQLSAGAVQASLGALGVSAAAFGLASMVRTAIDAADELNKLSQRTGIATERLSELQFAAKLSDVSTDLLATSMKKLNVSISEGLGGDKEKIELFKNLGVSLRDASGSAITADKALLKIADTFSTAKDGAVKVAYGHGLMGKSADEMIPLLNQGSRAILELMDAARRMGKSIGGDFAKQAEEFNDNLSIAKASGDKLAITLAGNLVGSLGKAAKAMADAAVDGGKLAGILAGIQTFLTGDDRHKANVEMVETAGRILEVQNAIDKIASKGQNLTGQDAATLRNLRSELALMQDRYKTAKAYGQVLDGNAKKTEAGKPKKEKDLPTPPDGGVSAKESEYEKLNKEIERNLSLAQSELDAGAALSAADRYQIEGLQKLIDAFAEGKISLREYIDLESKLADVVGERKAIELRDADRKALAKSREEEVKTREAAIEAAYKDVDALTAELEKEREHLASIGLTTRQLVELEAAKLDVAAATKEKMAVEEEENDGDLVLAATYRNQAKLLRDVAAAKLGSATREAGLEAEKRQLEGQLDAWRDILGISRDFTHDLLTDTSHAVQKLGGNIKTYLLDQMVKLVEREWVIPIFAQLTGASGSMLQAAGGAGGGGSLLGAGANFVGGSGMYGIGTVGSQFLGGSMSGGNAAGTLYANATGGGLDALLATNGAYGTAIAGTGITTSAAGAVTFGAVDATVAGGLLGAEAAPLAAAGPVGWIALAALAAYAIFSGEGGGPKQEGGFGPLVDNRGDSSAAGSLAGSIGATYTNIANALGLAQNTLKDVSVFFAKDPEGTAQTQLEVSSGNYSRSSMYGGVTENVGRSDAEFNAAVSLASAQLVVAELQKAAKGPVGDFLRGVDLTSASLATLNTALQTAQDVGSFTKVIEAFGGAFDGLKSLSVQNTEAMIVGFGGLQAAAGELQAFYNDFTPEAEKQNAIWRSLVGTFTEANVVLPSTRDAFRAAVDAAIAAGDTDALQTLLGAEQAFNRLYPAIDKTAAAASAAADWQSAYFRSWTAVGNAASSSAKATSSAWGSVFSSMRDDFSELMGSIKDKVAEIRGELISDPVGVTLSSAQANFDSLVAQVKMGGSGSMAAAQQLGEAADLLLNVAQGSGMEALPLSLLKAKTAQALVNVQAPLQKVQAAQMKSAVLASWGVSGGADAGYASPSRTRQVSASGISDESTRHIKAMSDRIGELHAVVSRQQETLGDLLNGRQRAPLQVQVLT